MCDKDTSGAHRCIKCDRSIHVVCRTVLSEEGYGSKRCVQTVRQTTSGAMDNQLKQANMMVARSKKELGTPEVDQTVAIPMPLFDRGKGDSRNVVGRIIEVHLNSNVFFSHPFPK